MMRKCLFVVNVGDYFPELMQYTLPNLRYFAEKNGAEFQLITERKYPDFPPTYEKLQVYDLGKDNDWNMLIDADFMLHPNFWDPTEMLDPAYVGFHAGYEASDQFVMDDYFRRDGRNRGISTNFVISSKACHDLWTPLEFGWDVAQRKLSRKHIIDEYCVSRNLSRFALKYSGICPNNEFNFMFEHLGLMDRSQEEIERCIQTAKELAEKWEKFK